MAKSDAQRGPYGAWAYRTRTALDLNSAWVADQLGYTRPTLVKVEAGSIPPSARMLRDLPQLYEREAARLGRSIEPPPRIGAPSPADNMAALVDLVTLQTQELKRLWETQSQTLAALTTVAESLTILASELRAGREEAPEWALAALQLARSLGPAAPLDGVPSELRESATPRRRRR